MIGLLDVKKTIGLLDIKKGSDSIKNDINSKMAIELEKKIMQAL